MSTITGTLNEAGMIWKGDRIGIGVKQKGKRIVRLRCTEEVARIAAKFLYETVEVECSDGIVLAVRKVKS